MLEALIGELLDLLDSLPMLFGLIVILLVCGYALIRGGPDERLTGAVLLIAYLAAPFLQNRVDWQAPQYGLMVSDVLLAGYFVWLALRSDRYWPVWAAGFQLLTLFAWLAFLFEPGVRALMIVFNLIGYLILGALLVGVNGWRTRLNAASAPGGH